MIRLRSLTALLLMTACKPEAASAPAEPPPAALPPPLTFAEDQGQLLFSYVDASGAVKSADRLADVPVERRKNLMVVDLSKTPEERQADRYVYFVDATVKNPEGKLQANVVSRYQAPSLAAGAVEAGGEGEGKDVVVYSAVWCGYCKKTKAYLKERGVPFRERDVEKDAGAERELQAKARKAGVRVSGVPVTDFMGELVMGFDQARLDSLIKSKAVH